MTSFPVSVPIEFAEAEGGQAEAQGERDRVE